MMTIQVILQIITSFPDIEKSQIVAKINHSRFSLCFKKEAIINNPQAISFQTGNPRETNQLSASQIYDDQSKALEEMN